MRYLILFSILIFTCNINAQTNCLEHELLCPDNQWNELHSYVITSTTKLKISEDKVLLSDNWYAEVLSSVKDDDNSWEGTNTYLREEGDKVWKYNRNSETESLIYDFGLSVGDTTQQLDTEYDRLVVDSIKDIVVYDGSVRKSIYLHCLNDIDGAGYGVILWIEGIGYTGSLLTTHCATDINTWLKCFYIDGQLVYYFEDNDDPCWIPWTGVDEAESIEFRIHPNPTSNYLYIDYDDTPIRYKISDSNGNVVLDGDYEQRIDMRGLVSGMYFIQIINSKGEFAIDKFVKIY